MVGHSLIESLMAGFSSCGKAVAVFYPIMVDPLLFLRRDFGILLVIPITISDTSLFPLFSPRNGYARENYRPGLDSLAFHRHYSKTLPDGMDDAFCPSVR
jgi:hypothetical protein